MTQRFSPLVVGAGVLLGIALTAPAQARTLITADGPGGTPTYDILGRAFTLETPDCGHKVPHITEVFDDELKKNVFVFHIHVKEDDDRCGKTDRQRTEIRGGKLGEVVASNGQTVYYRWKFRLPEGFQTSPNFTHIMQIKSDAAAPVMTLTPRNATLSIDGIVGVRGTQPLAKFIGTWVVASMKIVFGTGGHIDLTIKKIAGGETLFDYSGGADTWQGDGSGHDPKWGIYRSLSNPGALRDEQVRFADFCISKTSAAECDDGTGPPDPTPPSPDAGGSTAPDAGGTPPKPDAGSGPTTPRDSAASTPDPTPTTPDAAPSTAHLDAAATPGSKPPTMMPPPTEEPPSEQPARKAAGGCAVAGPGSAASFVLLLGALAMLRRRR